MRVILRVLLILVGALIGGVAGSVALYKFTYTPSTEIDSPKYPEGVEMTEVYNPYLHQHMWAISRSELLALLLASVVIGGISGGLLTRRLARRTPD